jgi:hypothetical protein
MLARHVGRAADQRLVGDRRDHQLVLEPLRGGEAQADAGELDRHAALAQVKPTVLWVPSQKGRIWERPQRQRATTLRDTSISLPF